MATVKVLRREYRQIRQAELASFVENIVNRTKDTAPYLDPALQDKITALSQCLQDYVRTLAATRSGGPDQTVAKDLMKRKLLGELDVFVNFLESKTQGEPTFITGAGFSLWADPQRRLGEVEPPRNIRASGTGRRGEVRIALQDPLPSIVLTHGIEYSTDKGANWHNSTYRNHSNFVVTNLPHSPEMLIRVQTLATRNRRSDWSEPVMVAVP